ncbi:MAG: adenylate cyclase regulatory domain-containing protein [Actinomycetota bacterium]
MDEATRDRFVAAGLYDPVRDADTDRLELLDWLLASGLSVDELIDADRRLALAASAGDRRLVPGERLGRARAIADSGLPPRRFDAIAAAFGMVPIHGAPDGEVGFVAEEVAAIAAVGALVDVFSESEALSFVRVMGASLARLGEAAVSLFLADVEGPHLIAGHGELDLAHKVFEAVGLLDELTRHLDPLLRRQVLQAIERSRATTIGETERVRYRYAVGFVDLVGFTTLSGSMDTMELTAFLRRFEERAFAVAAQHGARVVKLIGDEVMFVATEPGRACATGRALIEQFGADGVAPRGGVAYGDVLLRGGDYFGSVVNLASRLVDEAVPGELLVTDELAAASTECRFEPAGRRHVKGFDEPVRVSSLAT